MSQERRQEQRQDAKLSIGLKAGAEGEALKVSSLNISAGGVYVEVPHFIEPLTKLALSLEIPGPTPGESSVLVEAEAIVVRTVPEAADPNTDVYEVACAFLELRDDYRDAINRYILTHRTASPS